MGGVSVQLVPFLQSFVLRTVCALRGAGGVSEDCSSLRPCETSPGSLCLAGSQSHSPGDSRCLRPAVPLASLAGLGCFAGACRHGQLLLARGGRTCPL